MRLVRAARRAKHSDDGLQIAADGVLRGPAARGLLADKMPVAEHVAQSDAYLKDWLDVMAPADKAPASRVALLRLAPIMENSGSLASYTSQELMTGFMEQEEDTPAFVVKGQLAKNGKWASGMPGASHISGRVVTSIPCESTFDPTAAQASVFAAIEKHIERVMQGEDVTVIAFGQTGAGKTYTSARTARPTAPPARWRPVP